jgi:hypothetical protein
MLYALIAAVLMAFAGPAMAEETNDTSVVAQQEQPSPPPPQRDCERNRGEGVS